MLNSFNENGILFENCDCIPKLKSMPSESVDCVLTDIPFGEVNRKSNGLRNLNKHNADIVTFDLESLVAELCRISRGSIYIFCGREQMSTIYRNVTWGGV